jgi:hypothetical protein
VHADLIAMAPHVDSNAASSRITVLSNHIIAASLIDHTTSLEQLAPRTTDARSEVRPTPNGGKGKLHVTDDRTGKNYELEIKDGGVVAATDFKKVGIFYQNKLGTNLLQDVFDYLVL